MSQFRIKGIDYTDDSLQHGLGKGSGRGRPVGSKNGQVMPGAAYMKGYKIVGQKAEGADGSPLPTYSKNNPNQNRRDRGQSGGGTRRLLSESSRSSRPAQRRSSNAPASTPIANALKNRNVGVVSAPAANVARGRNAVNQLMGENANKPLAYTTYNGNNARIKTGDLTPIDRSKYVERPANVANTANQPTDVADTSSKPVSNSANEARVANVERRIDQNATNAAKQETPEQKSFWDNIGGWFAQAGKDIADTAVGAWNTASGAFNDASKWVGDRLNDAGEWAQTAYNDVSNWVGARSKEFGDWVGNATNDVGRFVGDTANNVGQWVGNAANDVGRFVGDTANNVGQWVGNAANDVGRFVGDTANNVGRAVNEFWNGRDVNPGDYDLVGRAPKPYHEAGARENIGNFINNAGQWIGNAANDVGRFVGDTANNVGQWVGNAANDVSQFVTNIPNAIQDAWEGPVRYNPQARTRTVQNPDGTTSTINYGGYERSGGLRGDIQNVLNGAANMATDAWNGVTTAANDAWNGLRNSEPVQAADRWWNGNGELTTLRPDQDGAAGNRHQSMEPSYDRGARGYFEDNFVTPAANFVNNAGEFVRNSWEGAPAALNNAWDNTRNFVQNSWEGAPAALNDLWNNGVQFVGDRASDFGQWAGNTANNLGQLAGNTANNIGRWAGDRLNDAGELINNGLELAGNAANEAGRAATNTWNSATAPIRDAIDDQNVRGLARQTPAYQNAPAESRAQIENDFTDRYKSARNYTAVKNAVSAGVPTAQVNSLLNNFASGSIDSYVFLNELSRLSNMYANGLQ